MSVFAGTVLSKHKTKENDVKDLNNWKEIKSTMKDLFAFSPSFLFMIVIYFIYSIIYTYLYLNLDLPSDVGTTLGFISVLIGLISIYYAAYIFRKSTKQLEESQVDYWNKQGIDYCKQEKYDDALQSYERAIDIDPLSSKVWINKANVLSDKGQYKNAIETIEWAIELEDPRSNRYPRALNSKGEILFKQRKYNEAIETFEEAIEQNPQLNYPWINKGAALYELGKYDKAIEAYNEAIKLDPKFIGVYYNKGKAHHSKKQYEDAIEALDKAIERFDKTRPEQLDRHAIDLYARIWCEKAATLKDQKKNDDALDNAINAYNKAIDFNPQYIVAWYNKGNIFRDKGEYDQAIEAYDKAIDINPLDIDVLSAKGEVLFRQGKYGKALEAFDKIIAIAPKQFPAYFAALVNRGNALCGLEKFNEALETFEQAKKLDPFSTIVLENMSLVLQALGHNEEAKATSEKVKKLTLLEMGDHSSPYID